MVWMLQLRLCALYIFLIIVCLGTFAIIKMVRDQDERLATYLGIQIQRNEPLIVDNSEDAVRARINFIQN